MSDTDRRPAQTLVLNKLEASNIKCLILSHTSASLSTTTNTVTTPIPLKKLASLCAYTVFPKSVNKKINELR